MSNLPIKRACDACHRRKVRCTGGQPCRNCGQASLHCTYNAIPQKKGPKGSRAKVISELRDTQRQTDLAQKIQNYSLENPFDFNSPPASPSQRRNPDVLSQQMIDGCIDFFFSHMYPTMPILHRGNLVDKVTRDIDRSVEVYCLITSLCAFMMIQPGMAFPPTYPLDDEALFENRNATATVLLEEVSRVRRGHDYVESPSLEAVQTSFFLFASYFGLDRHTTAWFHLREATTLAQMIGMQDEPTYLTGDVVDNTMRRRLYWLLFLTERAYALQRHRPLSLHATIELPNVDDDPSESPTIQGFLHMINLFRPFDDTFVGLWNKARNDCSTAWLADLQQQLTDALPPNLNSTESQAADIRTTQQWLRTMVWQLSITNGYLSSSSPDSSMTFKYPIEIARDLVSDVSLLSLQSMEVHGIGLIEKLFDVACTLTDVIACVPLDNGHFELGPSDYLTEFLGLISRLRGGSSRFFPLLIAKVSENLPSLNAPIIQMPSQIPIQMPNPGRIDQLSPASTSKSVPLVNSSPMLMASSCASAPVTMPDQSLIFAGLSPAGFSPNAMDSLTPLGTPKVAAPIPRSVPRIQFDGYFG